jgi:hypothetical protein
MDEMNGRILRPHENIIDFDLPLDFVDHPDEGCELANSCLQCSFPRCIREEKNGETRWLKQERAREMARLLNSKEKSVKELSAMFGISPRTLYRELKMHRDEKSSSAGRRKQKKFISGMKTGTNKGGNRK